MKKLALILFLIFTSCAIGSENYNYISSQTITPDLISPPLAADSKELADEARQIISLQKNLTPSQIAQAEDETDMKLQIITKIIDNMDENNSPKTFALLGKVGAECGVIVHQAKNFWHTKRPYLANKKIKTLITAPAQNSYAYPSGHTACSLVLTEVLGQLYPSKRPELRQRAHEIAQNRVIGGMHWPHDIKGGQQIGWMIFGALQQSTKFQSDLEKAKTEVK